MKKNQIFKIIMVICLALGIMLTACACNGEPAETKGTEAPTEKPTEKPTEEPTEAPTDPVAPSTVTYKVTVVDINEEPLKGASVQLCTETGCQLPVITGDDGVALITTKKDTYTAKIDLEGYTHLELSFPEDSTELVATMSVIPGTDASNPIWFNIADDGSVSPITIEAGASVYYTHRVGGSTMTIAGSNNITVKLGEDTYSAVENKVIIDIPDTYSNTTPPVFVITNTGASDAFCAVSFVYPEGSMNNPVELVSGENSVVIAEDSQGYFYTLTAESNGTITFEIAEGCDNWTYVINNNTTSVAGENHSSDDAEPQTSQTVEISAGDVIRIILGTADHNEGTVTFTVTIGYNG